MCNTNTITTSAAMNGGVATSTTAGEKSSHLYLTILPITKPKQQGSEKASKLIHEASKLFNLSSPIAITALLLYSRSIVSMLFLGTLGDLQLAGGSLAVAFGNITGYSLLSGLSLGMEPLCSQAFGANQPKLLSLTLHRSILFLLCSSIPISLLWLTMSKILLFLGQDPGITSLAQSYLLFSLPDLISFSFIHPIRIYLRSQGITKPLTLAAAFSAALHLPANLILVTHFRLGLTGVATAAAASNLSLLLSLLLYIHLSGVTAWQGPTRECLTGWGPLARLSIPSAVSVCLEWWWYELMILLCGVLPDPKPAVASMGVLIQTTSLVYVFPSSLGFGVSTRVGNELGANRPKRARTSAAVSVVVAGLMGVLAMSFATSMRNQWACMFTNDPEIQRLTAAALPIVGLCELGNCPQTVGCGVLRGSARPAHAAHVNLGAFYLVGLPVAVGLGFGLGFGFTGFWMGLLAAQVCCAGLMLYVVWSTDWEAQAQRAQVLTCAEASGPEGGFKDGVCYEPLISVKIDDEGFER
ncbi:protein DETOXIFICATION 51 [Dioscorea cayenensis subsp. rotundata]|uniref:Protein DETOXIFICATION n=1 Tax=Dioscorea cayennensis subsp. rotundata TaxID=55577 RepID=A0AB40AL87_DIOCR|nr:protein DETOXIFICATION 51 [Dioscorea cayenensis subsp. rotundata]